MQGGGGFGPPPGPPPGGGFGGPPPPAGPPGAPPPGGGFGPPPGPPPGGGFGPPPGGPIGGPPPGMGPAPGATDQMAMISVGTGGAALVLSCVSFICCAGWIAFPLGIAGIVTGIMFMQKEKQQPGLQGKPLAIAGMAMGGVAVLIPIIALILNLVLGVGAGMMQGLNQH